MLPPISAGDTIMLRRLAADALELLFLAAFLCFVATVAHP